MSQPASTHATSLPLQHIRIHGHEVGYRMGGEGPAVLLIHGMAGSSRTWRDVIPRLADATPSSRPTCWATASRPSPWATTRSVPSPAACATCWCPRRQQATIVGQSLGGGVAMQLAYQHPGVVERLVLVSSGGSDVRSAGCCGCSPSPAPSS